MSMHLGAQSYQISWKRVDVLCFKIWPTSSIQPSTKLLSLQNEFRVNEFRILISKKFFGWLFDSVVVSVLDCQSSGWDSNPRQGRNLVFEISVPPSQLSYNEYTDCTLSVGR